MPETLFEKIWSMHEVHRRDDGTSLLHIDRHFLHEGSMHAFSDLEARARQVRRPDLTVACADHYVPTTGTRGSIESIADAEIGRLVRRLHDNTSSAKIRLLGFGDPDQGIVHVVGPEQGLTQPGMTIVCGDSHTSTHGALGALAFGIGASEVAHVLATQTLWQRRPKLLRIDVKGELPPRLTAKDLILAIIARVGTTGATGHAVEFSGTGIQALSVEQRMTVCNMTIEAGGRAGLIAPDDKTLVYLEGRPLAPRGSAWTQAVAFWKTLFTDPAAHFDREVSISTTNLEPMATWGTTPADAVSIRERIPDPGEATDPTVKARMMAALEYMGLRARTQMTDIAIDQVFIGSCTNSRIEDLRTAAEVVRGRRTRIPAVIVPGSGRVKRQAEVEGLDRIFSEAGFEWREPGCSMCVGMNGDRVPPGQRCASTSNRNFEGRQGPRSRTHLVSPPTAAVAAITGRLMDFRELPG